MKVIITAVSTTLLTGSVLYPLLFLGAGRPVSWPLVVGMAGAGAGGIWLLARLRRQL